MPSPIGHAIAGAAIAWAVLPSHRTLNLTADPMTADDRRRALGALNPAAGLTFACMAAAAAPDLDLLFPGMHRTVTHSVTAVAVVTILAITVTGKVTERLAWRVALAIVAAYASHLLLDWLAFDGTAPRGIQLMWPFGDRWYISDWDLFRGTARRHIFTAQSMRINAIAITQEIWTLGPIAALAYVWHKARSTGNP